MTGVATRRGSNGSEAPDGTGAGDMGEESGANGSPDCAGVIVGMLKPLLRRPPGWEPEGGAAASPDMEGWAPGHPLPGDGVAILVRPDMGVVDGGTGDGAGEGTGNAWPPGAPAVAPGSAD